jgi:branched-chain amino acid transport system ATP-binding protein
MILKVNNIKVFYGEAIALSGLSLEIKRGEFIAVIGSNGAGKTTLVNTVSGLIHPEKGTIEFKGERIDNLPAHEIVKRGIVQIPEGRKLFGKLSVNENLLAGAYLLKSNEKIKQLLEEVYRMFPILKKRKNQLADTLSGGEQQMLAIGRGLMSDGELIIFDEPSLGLMPSFVKQVAETIKEMHVRGYTILLIEQNVQEALKLADRAYVIQNGNIILSGASKDLLNSDLVKKAYLGL